VESEKWKVKSGKLKLSALCFYTNLQNKSDIVLWGREKEKRGKRYGKDKGNCLFSFGV